MPDRYCGNPYSNLHKVQTQNLDLKQLVSITIGIPTVTVKHSGFGERFDDYTLETLLKPLINRFRSALDMCWTKVSSRLCKVFSVIAMFLATLARFCAV